ncbi:MAG: aminotransferase class I/II-fold pyridoxal phosphate-dependent enzyme [Actinomycetota bacterium]
MFQEAKRIKPIGSGIFAEIAAVKAATEAKGLSVIDLGIGSPDLPPPAHVIERLRDELSVRENYDYGSSDGLQEFRDAAAAWYSARFGVDLDPNGEVLTLMGSHDGLAHVPLTVLNPGDTALIPDPHYPVYQVGAILAEADIAPMRLREENGFLPDLNAIDGKTADRAKLMVLNYPNNPTAAVADLSFLEEAVAFAKKHDIVLVHDAAYSELALDGTKPPSLLQVEGAKDIAIEFHSVSKTYNIAGCRLGFVVGNRRVVGALARLKSNFDYGVFKAIQKAGVAALLGPQDIIDKNIAEYRSRSQVFIEGVAESGWRIEPSRATMFLWTRVPEGIMSLDFVLTMIREAGVAAIPGNAFGEFGEGYVRLAMVTTIDRLKEAAKRINEARII